MPLTVATRILIVLTLLAFPGVLAWLEDGSTGLTGSFLGASMVLLIATIWKVVRDCAPFDDRAFHRTRPGGDARSFRRATMILAFLLIALASMAAIRGVVLNLGWRATVASFFIVLTTLTCLTAAVATGFALSTDRRDMARRIALVMLAVPVVILLWKGGGRFMPGWRSIPGIGYHASGVMFWPVLGSIGYALAWWLASARKRWTAALVTAGCLGAVLPFLTRYPFVFNDDFPSLPVSPVVVERTAAAEAPQKRSFGGMYRIEGQLTARGLKEGEFVGFHELIHGNPGAAVFQAFLSPGWNGMAGSHLWRGILWNRSASTTSGQRMMMEFLVAQLPEPRVLDPRRDIDIMENWAGSLSGEPEARLALEEIAQSSWRLNGTVYRWESAGDFPVSEGGWGRLPDEGAVRVMPADPRLAVDMNSLTLRITLPLDFYSKHPRGSRYSDRGHRILTDLPVVLLRDPLDGKVRWLQVHPGQTGRSLASQWENFAASLENKDARPEQRPSLLRSRLYLFVPRPVGTVDVTLPPAK
jgi:hypothetical protein